MRRTMTRIGLRGIRKMLRWKKKAGLEHELKVRGVAMKEEEFKIAKEEGGKLNGISSVQTSRVKLSKYVDVKMWIRKWHH